MNATQKNKYKREWYAKNKDKVKAANQRYWQKKLALKQELKQQQIEFHTDKTVKFKLYASANLTIPSGVKYSYIPPNSAYLLVFTDKELQEPFREVPEGTPMSKDEREWVFACKVELNSKALQEQQAEILPLMDEFLTAVEKNLVEEQEKLKGEKK